MLEYSFFGGPKIAELFARQSRTIQITECHYINIVLLSISTVFSTDIEMIK